MGVDLFWKMNTPGSAEDQAMGEKHAPKITVMGEPRHGQRIKIRLEIGNGKHPNENAHFTQWIELRCNDLYVARADFAPVIMDPVAEFTMIVPGGDSLALSAISRCNLHGLWKSEATVKILQ